jgi:hypothetical protein
VPQFFEAAAHFGSDLPAVRVHTGGSALLERPHQEQRRAVLPAER